MKCNVLGGMILCLLLWTAEVHAQKTLRMKFVPGAKSTISLVNKTTVDTEFGENKNKTNLNMAIDLYQTVKEVNPDGSAVVLQKLSRIQMESTGGFVGVALKFDSNDLKEDDQVNALSQVMRPLIGAEFKVTYSNRGVVLDVEPPANLAKKATDTSTTVYQQIFGKESFKSMLSQSSVVLPEEPVSKGVKWETKFSSAAQAGGAAVTVSYVYAGTVQVDGKALEKLDVTMVIKLLESKLPDAPRLNIKKQSSSGTMYFDNQTGAMSHSEIKQLMQIEGQIGAMSLLQQTMTDVITTVR
ncbi:MAG: DUF6263 family protein [Pirellulales bacterium]|nr:hypothetical protein [Rhodopirellula sp.]MCH2371856.1 DUF6263 family protein [Pirellulales bacterium]|tara:strand:+ start:1834 stop:2727 length:894 start_codon:yes stop_codon:yes gene_type:complete